ncbi:MAG TPA: tripartite tricarboxylate transporter substrate binding protein [Beijerinckiaceae bacterium]|jgi:tripartite-type tricarboxylate transporter receptor subunit TctC
MSAIRKAAAGLALAAAVCAGPAGAQTQGRTEAPAWPTRAVRIITPQPPGTGIDLACRIFAERLSQVWGQPAVIENRPGGDGVTGVAAFVGAADDHTLLCSFGGPITITPFTSQTKLPYDPTADLKPIASLVDFVQAFAVSTAAGVDSLDALARKAKAEPGKLNWSSTQGIPLLLMSAWVRAADLDMAYVPYSTLAPALQDLGQGRIQAYATSYASLVPAIEAKSAKIVAVLNRDRAPQIPDVPTAAELGLPQLTIVSFTGLFAGRAAPDALRARIARQAQEIGKAADVNERLVKMGITVRTSTPSEFAAMIEEQRTTVQSILKATGGLPGQSKP